MTAREEALVQGSAAADEDIVRLDLLESDLPAWGEGVGASRARRRGRTLLAVSLGQTATDALCLLAGVWVATRIAPAEEPAAAVLPLLAAACAVWVAVFCAHG